MSPDHEADDGARPTAAKSAPTHAGLQEAKHAPKQVAMPVVGGHTEKRMTHLQMRTSACTPNGSATTKHVSKSTGCALRHVAQASRATSAMKHAGVLDPPTRLTAQTMRLHRWAP